MVDLSGSLRPKQPLWLEAALRLWGEGSALRLVDRRARITATHTIRQPELTSLHFLASCGGPNIGQAWRIFSPANPMPNGCRFKSSRPNFFVPQSLHVPIRQGEGSTDSLDQTAASGDAQLSLVRHAGSKWRQPAEQEEMTAAGETAKWRQQPGKRPLKLIAKADDAKLNGTAVRTLCAIHDLLSQDNEIAGAAPERAGSPQQPRKIRPFARPPCRAACPLPPKPASIPR